MKLRHLIDRGSWKDAWLPPTWELVVGCILARVVCGFWNNPDSGAISDVDYWETSLGAIIGVWFVYRAWKRRHDDPAYRQGGLTDSDNAYRRGVHGRSCRRSAAKGGWT